MMPNVQNLISSCQTNIKTAFFTRLSVKISLIGALAVLGGIQTVHAESISVVRNEARVTDDGQLAVSSRFKIELPDQLKQVLDRGVPLHFTLSYQLSAPTWAAYKFKLGQLVGDGNSVNYKLSYHPLTNRYRITVGTFSSEYNKLDTALRGIGAIANWKVLPEGTLSDTPLSEVKAETRLELSTAQLPKPFQINALTSRSWQLDSGWRSLSISGSR